MIMKTFLLGLGILIGTSHFAISQQTIATNGGNASGSGGSSSYSVGQLVYTTHAGTSGSVAQGVQQPYEISVVTGIEEAIGINLSLTAFPNPTSDFLTLEVKDLTLSTLHFQLYDMSGKLLQSEKITGSQTSIVMSNLVPATYFVKVYAVDWDESTEVVKGSKEIKTFKIIKQH